MSGTEQYEDVLAHVNTYSSPSDLRITDVRCVDIVGAPMHCILLKIYTNQGLVGFGEVRDDASKTYALMLKSRILGENPCNVDKIFRRLKQFGGPARQAGGVCGIELALWDLAGKAYGVPVYQMLGGKFRERIRLYCDTDVHGRATGQSMGQALKKRMEQGFTFLKMDVGIDQLLQTPGALSAPVGYLEEMQQFSDAYWRASKGSEDYRRARNRWYDIQNTAHPFTAVRLTARGLDVLDEYVAQVRATIGDEVPLAIDHIGHIGLDDCIKLAQRLDKYHLAWLEDMLPWQYTEQYVELARASTTPICTGEDIYLKENFKPLLASGGVAVIHPDILTSGGIYENKKIGDLAQDYGVAMAIHMAESPVACLAAVHSAAATENFLALEFHSTDVPWWQDIVTGIPGPLIQNGYIQVPERPGLGIEDLNDQVLREHLHPDFPGLWEETSQWDHEWSHDRLWS